MNNQQLLTYIKERNYNINTSEYAYVCSNCSAIDHIKYLYDNKFVLWTFSGNEIIFCVKP